MIFTQYKGEIFALLAAFLWSISAILFERLGKKIRPIEMTLLKGTFAAIMLSATMFLLREPLTNINPLGLVILLVSGAMGIGLGDTAYFEAIKELGARQALLLGVLAPPMTALLALVFLGESLISTSWMGILITIGGVAWVISEQQRNGKSKKSIDNASRNVRRGIAFGVLAAFSQAGGLVMSRYAFDFTTISALQSAILRLIAGAVVLYVWIKFKKQPLGEWSKKPQSWRTWLMLLLVSFVGTYVCIWLQQLAVQHAPAGITQTLLATSPLFILPITAIRGEKLTLRAVAGALVSVFGIMLLFGILG
jgi:drug/metabolite transporter (DMT)-like permease